MESPVHIGSTGCSCHLVRGDDVHRRIKLTECMSGTRLEVKLGEQRQALSSPGGWKFSGCNCETARQYSSCPTFPIFCLLGSTQNPSTVTQNLKQRAVTNSPNDSQVAFRFLFIYEQRSLVIHIVPINQFMIVSIWFLCGLTRKC